jgi:hypothetical protein
MTAAAKNTRGTVLKLAVSPGSPAAIAELTNITEGGMTRATIDATSHDGATQAMEFIADGVYDPGEISFEGNLIAESTADDLLKGAMETGALMVGELVFKAASGTATRDFTGIVTAYSIGEFPVAGGKQSFSCTVKLSGAVPQSADA